MAPRDTTKIAFTGQDIQKVETLDSMYAAGNILLTVNGHKVKLNVSQLPMALRDVTFEAELAREYYHARLKQPPTRK